MITFLSCWLINASFIQNSLLFIKIYSYLSILGGLIVVAAQLLRVVIHFIYKVRTQSFAHEGELAEDRFIQDDLINECQQLATGQDILIVSFKISLSNVKVSQTITAAFWIVGSYHSRPAQCPRSQRLSVHFYITNKSTDQQLVIP
jgi:hypothetical protein